MLAPCAIAPDDGDRAVVKRRTSRTSANGDNMPACPLAPAQTRISPSTPASSAFGMTHRKLRHASRCRLCARASPHRPAYRSGVIRASGICNFSQSYIVVIELVVARMHNLVHRDTARSGVTAPPPAARAAGQLGEPVVELFF